MGRLSLGFGFSLLVLGLIAHQFGFLMTFNQVFLINYIMNNLPNIQLIELFGVLLQLLGGFFIVSGFIISISNIVSIKLQNERRKIMSETRQMFEERINSLMAPQTLNIDSQVSVTHQSCRFCGAELTEKDIFCPVCGKSQK